MQLKPLRGEEPDKDTLIQMVEDYRQFVGTKAAFSIEHIWWEGTFDSKEEEMDFFLDEHSAPDPYETLSKWHDDACSAQAEAEVALIDTRRSRAFWRGVAVVLAIPYVALFWLWRSNS